MYVLAILGAPVLWALGLGVLHIAQSIQQRGRAYEQASPNSVAEIVARVEAEREAEGKSGRHWPPSNQKSSTRGDRSTEHIPKIRSRSERPPEWKPRPHPAGAKHPHT